MRLSRKAKWKHFYVGNLDGTMPVYQLDDNGEIEYMDIDGVLVPIETGKKQAAYSVTQEFDSNFDMGGGDVENSPSGLVLSDYDATIVLVQGQVDMDESSILYEDMPELNSDGHASKDGAVWSIGKIEETQNLVTYKLNRITS